MNRKKKIGLVVMVSTLLCMFGMFFAFRNSTLALFIDTDAAVNVIKTGTVTVDTEEKITQGVKYDVGAKNNGTVAAYVRMMVLIPDNQYLNFETTFYKVQNGKPQGWTYNGDDGYWYYDSKLAPDGIAVLYEKIKVTPKNETGSVTATEELLNKYGDVIVYVEAVQADNITIPEGEHPAKAAFAQLKKSTN